MFADRAHAGEQLAEILAPRFEHQRCRVYGLARGGVLVARPVAERLRAPLEVLVACKIGAPEQPELALGALAEGGGVFWDQGLLAAFHVARLARTAHQERTIERGGFGIGEITFGQPSGGLFVFTGGQMNAPDVKRAISIARLGLLQIPLHGLRVVVKMRRSFFGATPTASDVGLVISLA